ncbi:hypothetical protein Leryth_012917 [Lithospermum erythrorhizon]|nr:hypothetical protein Leryth_012917 [Lithospermum erythrorhizon]
MHFHFHQLTQPNQESMLDALYCEEESWEDEFTEENYVVTHKDESFSNIKIPFLLEQDFCWDDEELSSLLCKEQSFDGVGLYNAFLENPCFADARNDAIQWMLKVVGHYSFSALTAVLAVNYFDRFFSCSQPHNCVEKPWMIQLASVACLSLAAKVEETQVPLLLDFQVEESKYLFEAKTIQRMEILVLSTLEWKMNLVNPLSFIDYIIRRLGLENHLSWEFLRRCESLLLVVVSDWQFTSYLPSVLATATMLCVISNAEPSTLMEFQEQLLHILGINKDKVEDCCKLIKEVASNVDLYSSNKRKFASLPGSPKGVMEVSFSSSDYSNESFQLIDPDSVSSSPNPPLSKRSKMGDIFTIYG